MADVRKILIIFVIGILFSVLVFSVIEAVYPSPEYEDFCGREFEPRPIRVEKEAECPDLEISVEDQKACNEKEGNIMYRYDEHGCPNAYECSTCEKEYDDANEVYHLYVFYISAVLALIAIFIGLYLPAKQNTLNEWIGTGFMLGGTFALFFGTMQSFRHLGRFTRPIVIFLELVLVIYVAYMKIGNMRPDKKKK
jgi:hypothetical protein